MSDYDYGATYPPSSSPVPISVTTATYNYPATTGGAYPCGTLAIAYIFNRLCSVTTMNSAGSTVTQATYSYNSAGHPLTATKLISGSATLASSATYNNSNGTVATVTDVNGAISTYLYNGTNGCNNLLPTSVTVTGSGLPSAGLTKSKQWNCNGAVVTQATGFNQSQNTNYVYNDPLWRMTSMTDPMGNITTYSYAVNMLEVAMNFNGTTSTSDTLITTDGLGRQILSQTRQAQGSSSFDTIATTYGWDTIGAFTSRSSVPFTSSTEADLCVQGVCRCRICGKNPPVITTQADALGRPVSVTDAGGGTTSYTYIQNDVLQSAGPTPTFQKQFQYNGLGQLTSVCEITSLSGGGPCNQANSASGFLTTYVHDPLGNLLAVAQNAQSGAIGGTQTRAYVYDGLGRLTSEQNPESGITQYTYDTDSTCGTATGDIVKKIDAVGNVICYAHDGLHRSTSVTHPSGTYASVTPDSYFVYDAATVNGVTMQLVAGLTAEAYTVANGVGSSGAKITDEGFSYDLDGRLVAVSQSTPNSAGYYVTTASYWPNDTLWTLGGVPGLSGWTVVPDGEGRPNSATYDSSTPLDFVTSALYFPSNPTTTVTYGDSDTDVYSFDGTTGRMNQFEFNINGSTPASLTGALLWNANWTLVSLGITDGFTPSNTQTCSYGYDGLARVNSVNCTNGSNTEWTQTFTLDPFGNINKSGTTTFAATYVSTSGTTNNQEVSVSSCDPTYDANGNLTKDCVTNDKYAWNADGMPTTLDGKPITYDALGREVEFGPSSGATHTQILYSPIGKLGTMNGQTAVTIRVPMPGGSIAQLSGATGGTRRILHSDWLRSARLSTTYTDQTVSNDVSYAPYGESYIGSTTDLSFTGQSEDTLSGLYDFRYREYSPVQGRWISPDPAGLAAVDPANPQSWNRYAYVANTPLNTADPLGLCSQSHPCPFNYRNPFGDAFSGSFFAMTSGSFSYIVDGVEVPSTIGQGILSAGAGLQCPGNDCGPVTGLNGFLYSITLDEEDGWNYINPVTGNTFGDGSEYGLPALPNVGDPNSGGPTGGGPTPTPVQCTAKIVSALYRVLGNFTVASGPPFDAGIGAATNVVLSASGLSASQFNALQPGARWSLNSGFSASVLGIGPSLHIASPTSAFDSSWAIFSNSNDGGALSVTFTAHIDDGNPNLPLGLFQHLFTDLIGPIFGRSRPPC